MRGANGERRGRAQMTRRALMTLRPSTLAGSAAFTAVAFAVSRLLGLLREMLIAARFGTGETFDAYVAAFRIPDLIFVIVMSGAFGSAFIPVFSGFLARDDEASATALVNTLLTYTLIVLAALSLVVLTFAGPLVTTAIAPDLSPHGQETAINLTRIFLLSPLLLGLGACAKGMLESRGVFTLPAIAPIIYNLGIIVGIVVLAPWWGIYGLGIGVIIGSLGHAFIQSIWLLLHGYRFKPQFSPHTPGLSRVGRMLSGRLGTQFVAQANLIVTTNIASGLGAGAISSIYFGQSLVMLPHGIVAMSLATVIFPTLSRHHELGNRDEYRRILLQALTPTVFLTIPAMAVLIAFRTSIVQVLFAYGSFGPSSTHLVASILGVYATCLVARALIEPLTRAFYAINNTRTPMLVLIITTIFHALVGWFLAQEFGPVGLMLSLSLSVFIRTALLVALLSPRIGGLGITFLRGLRPMTIPTLAMTGASLLLAGPIARVTDPTTGRTPGDYALFLLALAFVTVIYLGVARFCHVPELAAVTDRIAQRIRHSP